MKRLQLAGYLVQYFGVGWLAYRLGYALRRRLGWLRWKLPVSSWNAQPLRNFLMDARLADPQTYLDWRKSTAPAFFFDPAQRMDFQPQFGSWDRDGADPCQEANQLEQGIFRYFAALDRPVGFPPDWHSSPFSGQSTPPDMHWSQIDDFGQGDIKGIWDLSRFRSAYILVRAYWRSGDERYPELFWRLVEDWRAHNPPQSGANWMCGQETSFRVMAWCFGLYGFLHSPASTPARVAALAQMIAVSGRRIEFNLPHALSQQNNHGVSEALGLWTVGLLFPELRSASRWLQKGRDLLESLGRKLIYPDGAFAQHSANYQRLALHDYLWAVRLGQVNGQTFSPELMKRLEKSAEFLYQVQDAVSGNLPCFGHDDGSLVLPLDSCSYPDYRPVIQAVAYLTGGERRYPDGPWDEGLLWLFGPQALKAPVKVRVRADFQAPQGGFYTLRSRIGLAFTHCPVFHHRPAHADLLHLDLWWRGENLTIDPGSYSYNAPPPWEYALAGGRFHNTVTVDGLDPMERPGRFLWLPWARGQVTGWQRSPGQALAYWEGEHDGYRQLSYPVRLRRGILQLGSDTWLVLDRLTSRGLHNYRLQWLLPDHPHTWDAQAGALVLDLPARRYQATVYASYPLAFNLVRGDETSPRGWCAPYYQQRKPALSLECTTQAESLWLWSLFAPVPIQAGFASGGSTAEVSGWIESGPWQDNPGWRANLSLVETGSRWLLKSVSLSGAEPDQLVLH